MAVSGTYRLSKRMGKGILSLVPVVPLLCCPPGAVSQQSLPLKIRVDPRVELLSLVFRLSGADEYNQGKVISYVSDVERHFGPFREHPAVKCASILRDSAGISYNAPMGLAVYLTDVTDLCERRALDTIPPELDQRWKPEHVRLMTGHLRSFVRESRFSEFFEAHQPLYRETVSRMEQVLQEEDMVGWFAKFFGRTHHAEFIVSIGLLNGGANYGARIRFPDGRDELHSIVGVWSTDSTGMPRFARRSILLTVVHEFCHSFANPIVDAHAGELKKAGETIFRAVEKEMTDQAYGDWKVMMYESLVRASVIRYQIMRKGTQGAVDWIEFERERGFLWTGDLSDLLGEYEKDRVRYPSLDSFMPRVSAFMTRYAGIVKGEVQRRADEKRKRLQELQDKSPKILSLNPPHGASDVDPNLKTIVFRFDRPMNRGNMGIMEVDQKRKLTMTGTAAYDSTGTILTIPVALKAGQSYVFSLNYDGFLVMKDTLGNPLVPTLVTFQTRSQ